jgi:alpha-tubulin suppressor-like RCC1 family protein
MVRRYRDVHPVRGVATIALLAALIAPSLAAASVAGDVYGFGSNGSGQLGAPVVAPGYSATPAVINLPGQSGPAIEVAGGEAHSLVLTATGQLYAFGDNTNGQLGNATNNNPAAPVANPTPALVTLPGASGPVTQIAAGSFHSLALTSTGQLYAFGLNESGQLGSTSNVGTRQANPVPALVSLPSGSGTVTAIAAGADHSLVLTATGQLYTFGSNRYGQLGDAINSGTQTANPTPALVSLPSGSGAVTQVAAGAYHSLALTAGGQLYAFGDNTYGALGNATNYGTSAANPVPAAVAMPTGSGAVTQVHAGDYHSLVVAGGGLYAFGDDYAGELGHPSPAGPSSSAVPALVTLPGANGWVVDAAGGDYSSLVVTTSGQLYAFGSNQEGQLGSAPVSTPNPTPTQVALPDGATIESVGRAVFGDHTLAIVSGLSVASASLPAAQVGVPYSATLLGSGGVAPYGWTAASLPAGLAIDAGGVLSGTPAAAGSSSPSFTLTDSHGIATSRTLALTVAAAGSTAPAAFALAAKPSVSGHRLTFRIRCAGAAGQTCRVGARLTTREKLHGPRITALAAKRRVKTRARTVTIALHSFTIPAGSTVREHLDLNHKGRSLLARFHRLPARLVLSANEIKSSRTVKFTARKKKRHAPRH